MKRQVLRVHKDTVVHKASGAHTGVTARTEVVLWKEMKLAAKLLHARCVYVCASGIWWEPVQRTRERETTEQLVDGRVFLRKP